MHENWAVLVDGDKILQVGPLSNLTIPNDQRSTEKQTTGNIIAPRPKCERFKTLWSDDGVVSYRELLKNILPDIRKAWDDSNRSSVSLLISSTYSAINFASKLTNRTVDLINQSKSPQNQTNKTLFRAARKSRQISKKLKRKKRDRSLSSTEYFPPLSQILTILARSFDKFNRKFSQKIGVEMIRNFLRLFLVLQLSSVT